MAYDRELAERVRELLAGAEGVVEQRMFGGLAFLVHGNMAVAASGGGGLLVRVDPDAGEAWFEDGRVSPMVMRGREMRGWLRVVGELDAAELDTWVSRGVSYARSLPPKAT
ncbi:TfoX/Sxy family protein [Terrabacter sp. NPDC080008]|uniref:TfoX/Sxy family protein n=1 Tax=Terrabacter sp. NPDC080008 TaxID=3155176 RepID=UPI00344DE036